MVEKGTLRLTESGMVALVDKKFIQMNDDLMDEVEGSLVH
jgi:hypothetical protein